MGVRASPERPRAEKFKISTTHGHLTDIKRVVKSGVCATRSEALRKAWYEAKAANTGMFREAGGR